MSDIDAISGWILQVLSDHGRISNIDLADRVGLSPSTCLAGWRASNGAV